MQIKSNNPNFGSGPNNGGRSQMAKGGNKDYEIQIIPDVGHGFRNVDTNKYLRVEDIAIDWIINKLEKTNRAN